MNSSVEINGAFSLQNWFVHDTGHIHSSQDIPSGGGKYSISIDADWIFLAFVSQTLPAVEGAHIYKLSFWAKRKGRSGAAELDFIRSDTVVAFKWSDVE